MSGPAGEPNIVEVDGVTVSFAVGRLRGAKRYVHAVRPVSFSVRTGSTLALVGESGSGKTTLVRAVLGLERTTSGRIVIDGRHEVGKSRVGALRDVVQAVFQDSAGALDPAMRIVDSVAEPLTTRMGRKQAREVAASWLERLGLGPGHHHKLPWELSGGQRQRVGIARAIAVEPRLLIADEPLSALDVSLQAQLVGIFEDLREELGLSMIFVSHDLGIVRHISDEVGVMYLGEMVEFGPTEQVFTDPGHPYTRALLDSIPDPDVALEERDHLTGEVGSMMPRDHGCVFASRCAVVRAECTTTPVIEPVQLGPDRWVKCLFPLAAAGDPAAGPVSDPRRTTTEAPQHRSPGPPRTDRVQDSAVS